MVVLAIAYVVCYIPAIVLACEVSVSYRGKYSLVQNDGVSILISLIKTQGCTIRR
jgi:hypothetical protein